MVDINKQREAALRELSEFVQIVADEGCGQYNWSMTKAEEMAATLMQKHDKTIREALQPAPVVDVEETNTITWHLMANDRPPVGARFVALYNDGGGSNMFERIRDDKYIDASGDACGDEWLDDYLFWAYVPDGYKFWFERD